MKNSQAYFVYVQNHVTQHLEQLSLQVGLYLLLAVICGAANVSLACKHTPQTASNHCVIEYKPSAQSPHCCMLIMLHHALIAASRYPLCPTVTQVF